MAAKAKSARGFLPLITENRNLVSPSPSTRATPQQDQVLFWVDATKRRIQEKVLANPNDEAAVTLSVLKQELVAVFIEVLQKKDRNSWKFLSEVLLHMKAYQNYLSVDSQEICHYVERIFTYMDVHKDEFYDLDIADSLQLIFPKAVDHVRSQRSLKKSSHGYSPLATPKPKPNDRLLKRKLPSLTLPDGTNPYKTELTMEFHRPIQKFLTFGDLDSTVADVALQTATREAIWNACLGTTALALSVQLPPGPDHVVPPVASDALITVAESVAESSDDEVLETSREEKMEEMSTPMNGREAVEHFAKCHHLGKIQFMYFNIAPNRHFCPYDVVEISKDRVKREHYIFSTFGVLHVMGGDHSESMSLAEWQRDAVLWSAASKIPFFKNYLIRKTFLRWRANVHFQRFAKVRHQVAVHLLSSMPCYGAALHQVLRLCQELLLVHFLPLTNSKCYQLSEFELAVSSAQKEAAVILEKFFRFQKVITNTVREELLKRISQYEAQHQSSLLVSKESHYLHNVKKQQRKDILKQLKHEASFFCTFVNLLKKILLSYLVHLAQDNVSLFVESFVSLSGSREAYFTTSLTFSSHDDMLCLSPPAEMFSGLISKMFKDIPSFLIQSATSLEEDEAMDKQSGDHQELPTQRLRLGAVLKEDEGYFDGQTRSEGRPEGCMLGNSATDVDCQESNVDPYFDTLSESNVAEKLDNDKQFQSAVSEVMQLNKTASDDLTDFLQKNAWLDEIYLFMKKWTTKESVLQWISAPAYVIEDYKIQVSEMGKLLHHFLHAIFLNDSGGMKIFYCGCNAQQKLNMIKQWRERIRNYESTYTTDNGLYFVDCTSVQETLLPKLDSIHQELCIFVNEQAVTLAEKFCSEMKTCIQNMTEKKTSIGEFAEYARNVKTYQRNLSSYQQQGEYIKSLFEVMRMAYRHLTPEEEKLEEAVMAYWNQFLVLLQEAMEFVNLQTPLIIQSLDSLFKKLEEEAKEICAKATSGKFLDPDQNPTAVLIEMAKLREQFYSIHKQMHEASKWKELITGEPFDVRFLAVMAGQMDARQEVWKYFEVATHSLREWRATIFKKFNVKRAMEKVTEWLKAAERIKRLLGEGDPVLTVWSNQLEDFKKHLPYLLKLSHPSLKVKHWQQIFLMVGHEYDPTYPYTVGDLMQLNLGSCGQMIDNVLSAAIAEEVVEQKLAAFHKLWIEREFKLAKHLPESLLRGGSDETLGKASLSRHSSGKMMQRKKLQSAKKSVNVTKSLDISRNGLDILIEVDQLKYILEDSRLTLQTMSSSPFLVMQSEEIHRWMTSLAEIDELLDLWYNCQTQWLYLLKIFDNEDLCQKLKNEAASFKTVHSSFTDFMSAVVADPLVLSILSKPRGDRHYRLHQGHRLRALLSSLIQQMEVILSSLSSFLEDARNQFPRLYFLSDQELVQLLAISRNPVAFLPFVRRCFHGIKNASFELPIGTTVRGSSSSSLTYVLNVDKLELVRLVGPQGEEVKLCKNVKPHSQATKWLADLEQTMKSSIQMALEACVKCKLDDEAKQPIQLLECFGKLMENELTAEDATSATASSVISSSSVVSASAAAPSHWMLTFPEQCVLTTEAIIWQRNVQHALSKNDKDLLKSYCSNVSNQLSQYSKVLQEINGLPPQSKSRKLIRSLLGNLVCQALHHRDVMNRLLERSDLSSNSFEWIRMLKYQMDVHSILNAKSMTPDSEKKSHQGTPSRSSGAPYGKLKTPSYGNLPHLDQDRTMVSTGYRFGQCLISQMDRTFAYDCEFIGTTRRLVVTPLTERAHLALSMAVGTFQCGTLSGSNGTGKSETIQDLAKAFGRHLVVINCNSELPMTVINRYMTGLIQSGSWGLFDNCERISEGMLSVLAQHLDFLTQTLHVLANTVGNQYGIRGQTGTDRKLSEKATRRNSLTTLHSLPVSTEDEELRSVKKIGLGRQTTVPHGFNEEGLLTYFEDPWVKERERRNSFDRDSGIKESADHGRNNKSVDQSLLYEHVTLHRKPKMNFEHLQQPTSSYKPQYIGSLLFNGKLCHANANYGCFMTVNMTEMTVAKIPENLKVSMRPCAMVSPDYRVITEVSLYCSGFEQYQTLAAKIVTFIDLIMRQLPSRAQYDFGLHTILSVVRLAAAWLSIQVRRKKCESLRQLGSAVSQKPRSRTSSSGSQPFDVKLNSDDLQDREEDNKSVVSGSSANSSLTSFLAASDCLAGEQELIIQALTSILLSRMATPDDSLRFKSLMRDVFPSSVRPKTSREPYSATVVSAIFEQLRCSNLCPSSCLVSKMLQLHSSLQWKQGVILTGSSGSGKTTAYQVLAQVLNQIHDDLLQNPRKDETLGLEKQNLVGIHSDGPVKGTATQLSSNSGVSSEGIHVVQDTERIVCPKVDVDVLFPNVFTHEELYGRYDGSRWQAGLLTTILKKAYSQADLSSRWKPARAVSGTNDRCTSKWIILDGQLNAEWVDTLTGLLDNGGHTSLPNGETLSLHESTRMLFELSDFSNASPSMISRCAVVNFADDTIGWKSLVDTWSKSANERWIISSSSLQVLNSLVSAIFPASVTFTQKELLTFSLMHGLSLPSKGCGIVPGFAEVSTYLNIFSALMDQHFSREKFEQKEKLQQQERQARGNVADFNGSSDRAARAMSSTAHAENAIPNYLVTLKRLFVFAYIWGFGARLNERSVKKFDEFAREILHKTLSSLALPEEDSGTLFDFGIDCKLGRFLPWGEMSQEKTRHASQNLFILVPELERYNFWIELFLNSHKPLLITGDVGIGKSSLIENAVAGRQSFSTAVMTENLSSSRFQRQIISSLPDRKGTNHLQSKSMTNRRHIVFIDDLNLAGYHNGVAGSLELLRQMLSQKALPDRKRQMLISVADVDVLAAATNPGSLGAGTSSIDARLLRLFTAFNMLSPSEKALHTIYGRLIQSWLDEFPLELFGNRKKLAELMVTGAMEMYHQVKANVRPMPGHPYCIFTLHDLSRIFGGMMLMSPRSQRQVRSKVDSPAGHVIPPVLRSLVRLWCHECSRVLGDRIVHPEDSKWFQLLLENTLCKVFCSDPPKSEQSGLILQPDLLPSSDGNCISSKHCSPTPLDAAGENTRWPSRATEVQSLQDEQVTEEKKTEDVDHPLKSIEQVVSHGQSLMDITFSKYILSSRRRTSLPPEDAKGYSESSLEHLMKALRGCLASLRHDLNLPQDMVFFGEAAQHIARLSRVLATPRGHALLIAEGFPTGRTTLVRLATHLAKCQFYELDHEMESDGDGSKVQMLLKECSQSVGVCGRQAVVLVHERISDALLADICAFMKYGTCPGLYEDDEISQIAGQMMPGQLKLMTKAKIFKAFEQFLQRVCKHLHFVICLQNEETLQEKLHRFPQLMTCVCHVDVYEPWSHQTLTTIADSWLRDSQLKVPVPWDEQNKSEQISLIARAMAYIHQSTILAASKQYLHQKLHHQFISPVTYREFVHSFRLIVANIAVQELEGLKKFDAGLQKVKDASEELTCQRHQLSEMEESHHNMTTKVANFVSSINQLKNELSEAQQTCKEEEGMIVSLTSSIKKIQSSSLEKYGQVDPTYKAALDSLESLEQHYVEEVRSYRQPPEGVQLVMDAVCLLFQVPSGWENAKLMLIRDRFFEDLVYFDKNNIPEEVFEKLGVYIRNPLFTCEEIAKSSIAAANVCQWVRAVYGYARVAQDMKPMLKELQESQSQLCASQVNLGKKRLAVQHMKSALRQEIAAYKEATALAKELEKQLRAMGKGVKESEHLLDSFAVHQRNWKNEAKEARSRLRSAVANGLLTAACISYFGPLNHQMRSSLIQDWLERSEIGDFDPGLDLQKPENLRALTMSSIHSQQTQRTDCGTSSQGDDALAIHEMERNLSLASDASVVRSKFQPRVPVVSSDVGASADSASASTGSASIRSVLAVSEDFTLHQVLSSSEETTCWEIEGLPLDPCSLDNALLMRGALLYSKHRWPLLVDPDGQAERWLHALLSSCNANRMNRNEADFIELFKENQKMEASMTTFDSASATSGTASENTESNKSAAVSEELGDDALSVPVLEVTDRPKNNLWIIASEDPDLPNRLMTAVLHGIVVLITKAERKILPKYLHPILFRQFQSDNEQHVTVEIGGKTVVCHRNFRLFLSISVPLNFKGDELKEVKIGKMSVIDLTLSQEGIVNHLLREILAIERPEFEAQKRSMVKDFQQHKKELDSCQADVMDRVLKMGEQMLADKTMQGFVDECKANVERLQAILGDAKTLQELLERKRVPYFSVATNCAKLYEIISRMTVLHPAYHMSFAELSTLVSETVVARYRGKGNTGALEARATELIDAATEAVFHRVSSTMFERHVYLFALLATFEKLRLSHQLTNNELALFVNGVDTSAVEDNAVCENKPLWMSKKVWLDCAALESALSIFRPLRESFNKHSGEWQEYFKCPFDILNPWPGNWVRSASVFQKCLLWRICVPERLWEICWPLVVHELGGTTHRPQNYNIREIYKKSSSSVPTVFLLPSSPFPSDTQELDCTQGGLCFSHPTYELQQLAREMSTENRVRTIACGLPTQVVEIESALKECTQMGYWLVLQNLHLCPQLSPGIAEHFQTAADSERVQISPVTHQSSKQFTPKDERTEGKEGGEVFHKDFRLWITASADHISSIPGILMQHGQIVTCEATNNFQNHLLCTYASTQMLFSRANIKDVTAYKIRSTTYQMALSLLHSLLLYRQNYTSLTTNKFGRFCNWSLDDLALVIDSLHLVAGNDCPDNTDIAELVGIIYGNRCSLTCDTKWVYEAAYSLLTSVNNPKEKVRCTSGVTSVLPLLLLNEKDGFERQLTSLIEPHPNTIGISADIQAEFLQIHSKRLLNDLVRVMGDPASLRIRFQTAYLTTETILLNIQVRLSKFPQIPPKNGSHLYPLDLFLQSELDAFQELLDLISTDVIQLLLIVRGELAPSPISHEAVIELSQHRIPPKWQKASLFSPVTEVLQWISVLERRLQLTIDYLPAKTRPAVFQIGAFNRPDRLLQVILLHSARQQFKSVHTSALDIQILPHGSDVSKQPLTGIYVEGLVLHNAIWNKYKASIDEGIASVGAKTSAADQVKMPVIWLRQKDKGINNQRDQEPSKYYYDCPIYASGKAVQQSYFGSLQLPSSVKPSVCLGRQVFLSCDYPK